MSLADLLAKVNHIHQQFITYEGGQQVIYIELNKALYVTIQAALLF